MYHSDCESCYLPALECLCCGKERGILESLVKRLNAYECYLRPLLINASCEQLDYAENATQTSTVLGGNQSRFKLQFAVQNTGTEHRLRIPLLAGCNCDRLSMQQRLFYNDIDCYGYASRGDVQTMSTYLDNVFSTDAAMSAFELIDSTGTTNQPTVRAIRGASLILQESRRVFSALLNNLPC
jgi:hypothetical protein